MQRLLKPHSPVEPHQPPVMRLAILVSDSDKDGRIAVSTASEQARDLSTEFRRLQELLELPQRSVVIATSERRHMSTRRTRLRQTKTSRTPSATGRRLPPLPAVNRGKRHESFIDIASTNLRRRPESDGLVDITTKKSVMSVET
jgi:hypothetical protein